MVGPCPPLGACTFHERPTHQSQDDQGHFDVAAACRPNHGIQTMYEFGWDIGGMERSRYFGYSKDLYHFDHFMVRAL